MSQADIIMIGWISVLAVIAFLGWYWDEDRG
jgi:uncharacterized membrane protein